MISKILNFLQKSNKQNDKGPQSKDSTPSWFEERYDTMIVQRNILLIFLFLCIVLVITSVIAVSYVSTSKSFEPFVIQIQKNTGITKIVNPINSEILSGNEALAEYFIKSYVNARETYNPVDFNTRARQIIRLMSTTPVYYQYLGYINDDKNNPALLYGDTNTTFLTTRSWSKLQKNKYIYRFAIQETTGQKTLHNKIAIIEFDYKAMELSETQREINPVGFTVTGYRVDQDDS